MCRYPQRGLEGGVSGAPLTNRSSINFDPFWRDRALYLREHPSSRWHRKAQGSGPAAGRVGSPIADWVADLPRPTG